MKYYISVLLLAVFFNLTYAQDSTNTCSNEPKHGIQFQVDGLITLRNFDDLTFSYRYAFNKTSGLRIGFLTSIHKDDYDISQQADTLFYNPPNKNKYYSFRVSVQYINRLMNWNDFSIIIGGGPFISYSKYEYTEGYLYNYSGIHTSTYENKDKIIGFGLSLISGIEYNLTSNVVLSGEYGLELLKENSDFERTDTYVYYNQGPDRVNKETGKRDTFELNTMSVKLGIAVFL